MNKEQLKGNRGKCFNQCSGGEAIDKVVSDGKRLEPDIGILAGNKTKMLFTQMQLLVDIFWLTKC
jgi:hypothetical protein